MHYKMGGSTRGLFHSFFLLLFTAPTALGQFLICSLSLSLSGRLQRK